MGRPAAFLDRDGTLVRDVGYARHASQLELLPGVLEGIERLRRAGFALVVVTNQSGIGRGLLDESGYRAQERRLEELLGPVAQYFCPHHPTEAKGAYRVACECRKPLPGMLLRAIRELDLDPARSIAIGDAERDLEAARAAGVPVAIRAGTIPFLEAVEAALRGDTARSASREPRAP